jgi:hypothetical protein
MAPGAVRRIRATSTADPGSSTLALAGKDLIEAAIERMADAHLGMLAVKSATRTFQRARSSKPVFDGAQNARPRDIELQGSVLRDIVGSGNKIHHVGNCDAVDDPEYGAAPKTWTVVLE